MRLRWAMLAGMGLCLVASRAWAVDAADLLFSQMTAERHGLTRAWYTQVPMDPSRSKVIAVVQDAGMIFVQTDSAMLHALNAETGQLVWSSQVGEPKRTTLPASANGAPPVEKPVEESAAKPAEHKDKVIAVVNGSTLYLISRADGSVFLDDKTKTDWKVQLRGTPVAGPLVTDDQVYVPMANGQIEIYDIKDSHNIAGFMNTSGRIEVPPTAVGDRIAWPSDTGIIHLTQPAGMAIRYWIPTSGPIGTPLISQSPRFFAASLDGFLYCLNENSGEIQWKLTAGSPVRQSPIAIRDAIYTCPEDGGMFRATVADGHQDWFNPAPRHFLAASRTKVYAVDRLGRMLIMDAKTGGTVEMVTLPEAVEPVANHDTDRIILSSESGLIQSLHEADLTTPENYVIPKPEKAEEPVKPKVVKPAEDNPKPPPDDDDKPKPAPKAKTPPPDPTPKTPPAPKTPRVPKTPRGTLTKKPPM